VRALLGADLLAKRRDACVCDERRVESIYAFPGRISCVSAASFNVSDRGVGGKGFRVARTVGAYGCPKYSTERDCIAREETNPSSSVSPATG
jgi:hypothetical protein